MEEAAIVIAIIWAFGAGLLLGQQLAYKHVFECLDREAIKTREFRKQLENIRRIGNA